MPAKHKQVYIIAGPNGGGKTTAAMTLQGGHGIPTETIKRRFLSGLNNLIHEYLPICDNVIIYDGSQWVLGATSLPVVVEKKNRRIKVVNGAIWQTINAQVK